MQILMHQKIMHEKWLLLLFFVIVLFPSCKQEDVYFRYNEIENGKWRGSDELIFDIDSSLLLIGQSYEMHLEVTNNTDYRYQNIWFRIEDNVANDTLFVQSEHEYKLADEFGKWKGTGFASLHQTNFLLKSKIQITQNRSYRIRISHGMHDEPLVGIEKVGIRIKPLYH